MADGSTAAAQPDPHRTDGASQVTPKVAAKHGPDASAIRAAACLIVKNEVMDIAAWVAHHLNVGFKWLVIYDNHSSDGTTEVLQLLARDWPIEVIRWAPTTSRNPRATQGAAYDHCVRAITKDCDWLAFLDADEYLVPASGQTLSGFLGGIGDASAVALNWTTFGSSMIVDGRGSNPLSTMLWRAENQSPVNNHVKCLLRPSEYRAVLNPHYFEVAGETVNVEDEPIVWSPDYGPGCVELERIRQGRLRVHHYCTRSLAHWQQRVRRGNWSGSRTDDDFHALDRNEVFDDTASRWGHAADLRFNDLRAAADIRVVADRYRTSELALRDRAAAEKQSVRIRAIRDLPEPSVVSGGDSQLTCFIDQLDDVVIRGWATRRDTPEPVSLRISLDGERIADITTDIEREDVAKAGWPCRTAGFRLEWPGEWLDGATRTLTIADAEDRSVALRHGGRIVPHLPVTLKRAPVILGVVDGWSRGHLRGWVVRRTGRGALAGGVQIEIRANGIRVATARADRPRSDVARSQNCDMFCGFEVSVPPAFRRSEPQQFHVVAVPDEMPLNGSPVTAMTVTQGGDVVAADLSDSVERLFKDVSLLRLQLRSIRREIRHDLATYDRWFRMYRDRLHVRAAEWRDADEGGVNGPHAPLVSVVMPVYRTELHHLETALDSVRQQTWPNWEVLMIDDGSGDKALTRLLDRTAASDRRFRHLGGSDINGGISHATNRGIEAAEGRWIAFMDHDDRLDPVALEVMVRAAAITGGRLLYSDEDKLDEHGVHVEPAFKPGFNPRLLLSYNYINHLVLIDANFARRVGPLRTELDGAQDHDFILRATAMLPENAIIHVPEVLYHWRRVATSTAAEAVAKPKARERGIRAVADGLARQGVSDAAVTAIEGTTHYAVRVPVPKTTPKVRIVIPFREQAASTRRCVEAILSRTDYPTYEIVLIDNWSAAAETAVFTSAIARHPRVRVLRVEEEFNYSRLNNLAVAGSDAEFFVLMNNDLFVEDADWLRVMIGEALLDPRVAVVAGKYLYPDRTLQHAGVIVGQGGVAGHFYGGRPTAHGGFAGRARVAQNLSAVTAACMLVRAEAYREVGGLDEANLAIAFNDVDFCLRVGEAGWLVVWTPDFVAEHHESLSRGADDQPHTIGRFYDEVQYMQRRWGSLLASDPHYSRFFLLEGEPFVDLIDPKDDDATLSPRPGTTLRPRPPSAVVEEARQTRRRRVKLKA